MRAGIWRSWSAASSAWSISRRRGRPTCDAAWPRGGSSSRRWRKCWRPMPNCSCWSGNSGGGDAADSPAAVAVRRQAGGVGGVLSRAGRRGLRVARGFGDDALAYFTERLDVGPTRTALSATVRRAKRNKAFSASGWIGVAIDGTGAGHCQAAGCGLCHPVRNAQGEVIGYLHHFVLISVVGAGLTLPFDVEPYGPGDWAA